MVAVVGEINLVDCNTAGLLVASGRKQKTCSELEGKPVTPAIHWQAKVHLLPFTVWLVLELNQSDILHSCCHCCYQELRFLRGFPKVVPEESVNETHP